MRSTLRLLTGFGGRRAEDEALDEELAFHLDQATARNVRRGMTPEDARRDAFTALGGRARWTEATRDEQRSRLLDDFLRDVRYGWLALRRNMGFALGAVLTIALSIAATTTVFNFVSAVYMRSLPVPEGARLVRIHGAHAATREEELGFPAYLRLRERTHTLDAVVAHYSTAPLYVLARGESGEVPGAVVSAEYFRMLGLTPALGRFFMADEDSVPDRDAVAVIGHGLWHRQFAADHHVVGEHISINGRSFTIIGVAPPGFDGIGGGLVNELWIPTMMLHTGYRYCDGFQFSCPITTIMARLAPGRTLREANAELDALRPTLQAGADSTRATQSFVVEAAVGIRDEEQGRYEKLSAMLWAIALVLLAVGAANVGGLLLARGMARQREFALRSSLGANRWRIVRQLLSESVLLGTLGGIAGVVLSFATSGAMSGFFTTNGRRLAMPIDLRMLLFALGASVVMVVLFGLFPALRVSRIDVSEALKSGHNRASNRARSVLVALQGVMAVVLLTAAGLLSRSFDRAMSGGALDPTHVAQVRLRPALVGYSVEKADRYFHAAVASLRALPGVVSVAPIHGSLDVRSRGAGTVTIALPGEVPADATSAARADYFDVGPDFFNTLRIPIVAGREFTDHDNASSPLVALVNESLAHRLWQTRDVVGQTMLLGGKSFQVVGVVKDYYPGAFGEAAVASAYVAFWQSAFEAPLDARVAIRVAGDPDAALTPIRRVLEAVDRSVPVTSATSMTREMRASFAEVRLGKMVLVASAALTLFLAAVGLFGVVSYVVAQRSRELAIRLAIGARPWDVLMLVMSQGLLPIGAGVTFGLLVAVATAPHLARWLYGIAPADVLTLLGATGTVTGVALIATLLPAYRAANTDAAAAFRAD